MTPEEYVEKRDQLLREIESLRPIDYDEMIEAADLIENFKTYWDQCAEFEDVLDARKQLVDKIIERVFVHEGEVLAAVLHGDFSIVLAENEEERESIAGALEIKMATSEISPRSRHGSDGHGTLTNRVVFTRKSGQYRFVLPKVLVA